MMVANPHPVWGAGFKHEAEVGFMPFFENILILYCPVKIESDFPFNSARKEIDERNSILGWPKWNFDNGLMLRNESYYTADGVPKYLIWFGLRPGCILAGELSPAKERAEMVGRSVSAINDGNLEYLCGRFVFFFRSRNYSYVSAQSLLGRLLRLPQLPRKTQERKNGDYRQYFREIDHFPLGGFFVSLLCTACGYCFLGWWILKLHNDRRNNGAFRWLFSMQHTREEKQTANNQWALEGGAG